LLQEQPPAPDKAKKKKQKKQKQKQKNAAQGMQLVALCVKNECRHWGESNNPPRRRDRGGIDGASDRSSFSPFLL
jgi:hypothetical protein